MKLKLTWNSFTFDHFSKCFLISPQNFFIRYSHEKVYCNGICKRTYTHCGAWGFGGVDYNLQIILIKVLKIILTITNKFEQNMNSLTWWWWAWYIFSSTSNYLQDLNQSRICTMIIITKKWHHSYFSQVIKISKCTVEPLKTDTPRDRAKCPS